MPRPSLVPRRAASPPPVDALADLAVAFINPGALRMRICVPASLPPRAPLVVVRHGCTQSAAGYDHASGWSRLAGQLGFAVLFPEQVRANNANLCFNWFEPGDVSRGHGEVASIAAAVAATVARYSLDPARVFVTGLSAGGVMAGALLATYPDVFAGGAVIAGLPFGAAGSVGDALGAMAHPQPRTPAILGDRVRAASSFTGPWPRVMVWHGTADRTVALANGAAVAAQWADVHGARPAGDGRWVGAGVGAGAGAVVKLIEVIGMGHGTPIDAAAGGIPAPFMLDVGVDSTAQTAAFWGLGAAPSARIPRPAASPPATAAREIGHVIANALRAAGLMK